MRVWVLNFVTCGDALLEIPAIFSSKPFIQGYMHVSKVKRLYIVDDVNALILCIAVFQSPNIHKSMCTRFEYEWDHRFLFESKRSWTEGSMIHETSNNLLQEYQRLVVFCGVGSLILQDSLRLLRLSQLRVRKVIKISLSPQAWCFVTLAVLCCSQHSSLQSTFPLHKHTIPCSSLVLSFLLGYLISIQQIVIFQLRFIEKEKKCLCWNVCKILLCCFVHTFNTNSTKRVFDIIKNKWTWMWQYFITLVVVCIKAVWKLNGVLKSYITTFENNIPLTLNSLNQMSYPASSLY